MDKLEWQALLSFQHINPYKCFVHDIYAQATKFHAYVIYQHPSIKFLIEKPSVSLMGAPCHHLIYMHLSLETQFSSADWYGVLVGW